MLIFSIAVPLVADSQHQVAKKRCSNPDDLVGILATKQIPGTISQVVGVEEIEEGVNTASLRPHCNRQEMDWAARKKDQLHHRVTENNLAKSSPPKECYRGELVQQYPAGFNSNVRGMTFVLIGQDKAQEKKQRKRKEKIKNKRKQILVWLGGCPAMPGWIQDQRYWRR